MLFKINYITLFVLTGLLFIHGRSEAQSITGISNLFIFSNVKAPSATTFAFSNIYLFDNEIDHTVPVTAISNSFIFNTQLFPTIPTVSQTYLFSFNTQLFPTIPNISQTNTFSFNTSIPFTNSVFSHSASFVFNNISNPTPPGEVLSGNSNIFTFDTKLNTFNGVVKDDETLNPLIGATITLTGYGLYFSTLSVQYGEYSITNIPSGLYLLTISKTGYISNNQYIFITSQGTPFHYTFLEPTNNNTSIKLVINENLSAYADQIIESPANLFTLNGNVQLNNVLHFDGEIVIDKRPHLVNPELRGSCGMYTTEIGSQPTYWIKSSSIPMRYAIEGNKLKPISYAFIIDGSLSIGGFGIKLGGIEVDSEEDYVSISAIAKMPFPINKVDKQLIKEHANNLNGYIEKIAGGIILSKQNGVQYDVNIDIAKVNIGIVSIDELNLYFNTNTQTYGGGFTMKIPGKKTANRNTQVADSLLTDFGQLPVEIRNEEGLVIDSLNMDEFVGKMRASGFELLSFGAQIEFIQGAINKIIITIGTKVPIGPTGLFITEITGGLDDLATDKWKIIANVDIETGVEVPALGSPVKFDDFGVIIQPWEVFTGSGAFEVFKQKVAKGYIKYNAPIKALSGNCELGLSNILSGKINLSLQGGKINGSGIMTLKTPDNLPWYLLWAQNIRIGSAFTELNNQYIQSEVRLPGISLAQKMEFGKQSFPWFHLYLGINLKNLVQVWKGTKEGKTALNFNVPENSGQLLVVAMDSIDPKLFDFVLQSPNGQLIDHSNAYYYEQNAEHKQTIMSIKQPFPGEWLLLTTYDGEIALHTSVIDQKPVTMVDQPSGKKSRSNDISLLFNDYADTMQVQVFYTDNNRYFNGSLIQEFTITNNAALNFTWQNDEIPNGEYYIYTRVDDGKNTPVYQFAPGSIMVDHQINVETPQNLTCIQQGDSLLVSWTQAAGSNVVAAIIYAKDLSSWNIQQDAVSDDNKIFLTGLSPGKGYDVWCRFVDEEGLLSELSNIKSIVFTNNSRNNPPYFSMNPEDEQLFISGVEQSINLVAIDADNDVLSFSIPGDTLGITVLNNKLQWRPTSDEIGSYVVQLVVSDGSATDTTSLKINVYTEDQLSTNLSFNTVKLYEADNTFIILKNFFEANDIQAVTLTNIRTGQQTEVSCRRVNQFEYMGLFQLSFERKTAINVANGDTIRASYFYDNQLYEAFAYYDSLPQPSDQIAPGTIADIEIEAMPNNQVKLKWTAPGNDGTSGKAYRYDIRYAYESITTEDVYFTAYRISTPVYPSYSGVLDSIIISLNELQAVGNNSRVYFSIKAEDEAQNRSSLSNSAGANCLISPYNFTTNLEDVYRMHLNWDGPLPSETNILFNSYNIFRKYNDFEMTLFQNNIKTLSFIDNLKIMPDGNYQYAIQAIYDTGESDTVFTNQISLSRFVDVNILCALDGAYSHEGINFEMTALDTIYGQSFERQTNTTGLILLDNVFKSSYLITASKDGWVTIYDTITTTDEQTLFDLSLSCDPTIPFDLSLDSISETSTFIKWHSNGYEAKWNIIYGLHGFNPMNQGTLLTYVFVNQFHLTGLNPSTEYDCYVRSVCGSNNVSNWSPPITFTTAGSKVLATTVLLEGCYAGSNSMSTLLNTFIPHTQPYSASPWNYTGTETVIDMPANTVDWVLVELRQAASPELAMQTTILSGWPKAMLLMQDGSIKDVDGSSPLMGSATGDNLYIVIRHRNHLDLMSSAPLTLSGNTYTYNFTDALTKAYGAGAGYKQIATGVFGMVAGDGDADGSIFMSDRTLWRSNLGISSSYQSTDFDMDGNSFMSDRAVWRGNLGVSNPASQPLNSPIYKSQVPRDNKTNNQ